MAQGARKGGPRRLTGLTELSAQAEQGRAANAKWYQAHRDRVRDYNRRRDGAHELVAGVCADCAKPYRTRIGSAVCSPCRAMAKNATISRQNLLACRRGTPSIAPLSTPETG